MTGDSSPVHHGDGPEAHPDAERPLTTAHAIPQGSLVCVRCGAPIPPGRDQRSNRRQYCAGACRASASRQRRARELAVLLADMERLATKLRPRPR